MPRPGHDPDWPDKILAAALMVFIAGLVALMQAGLHAAGASWKQDPDSFLYSIPTWWLVATGSVTTLLGWFGFRHQSSLLTILGILVGIASFGLLGTSTLISVAAVVPLVLSFKEGEETKLDRHRMRGYQWPDKAIMASVLLLGAGAVCLVQALLLFLDRAAAPVMPSNPLMWAVVSGVAGAVAIIGARNAFNLKHQWTAWTGAALALAAAAFYVVGPALALGAMVYLILAYREAEFLLHAPQKAQVT